MDRNKLVPDGIVDSTRLEHILNYNSFESVDLAEQMLKNKYKNSFEEKNNGLWIVPSYLNHSCLPNTVRIYLKDIVMIYAFKDIQKDQEVTTQYVGFDSFSCREEVFFRNICIK